MKKYFVIGMRILGIVLVAHALMLIGADEISTIESGGVRTIRSLEHILTLYGADPKTWALGLPAAFARTVTAIMAGLLPILWSSGTGSELMRRIAVPMVGGMVSSTILTLLVVPAIYALVKRWQLSRIPVSRSAAKRRAGSPAE